MGDKQGACVYIYIYTGGESWNEESRKASAV
jgi:hypothetical protein